MSNKPIAMLQVRRILQLKSQGKSNRDIALEVHRSRNTVNEYVKLILKIIKSGARAVHYKSALDWLSASAMVNKCIKVFQGRVPLNAFAEASSFKLYMADTGLLCAGYGISPEVFQRESTAWQAIKGALTENYVASA